MIIYHSIGESFMQLIDGKAVAKDIQDEIKDKVETLQGRPPCLAVIIVGENPASQIYVGRKIKACENVGFKSIYRTFPADISETDLISEIEALNQDPEVDGILVQLPLPNHINASKINETINPEKDVDGFHPLNMGKLLIGDNDGFIPCTPLGIRELLIRSEIDITGKHAVVIGRSNIVGKPMSALLVQNGKGGNATVTIVHSRSENFLDMCKSADLLIVAIGKPNFVTLDMIKPGAIIIDVGINKIEDSSRKSGYKIVGDVDFENVKDHCSAITPVPGGVGPMTIAMLLQNTLTSYLRREHLA